ncbi:hypothetical protein B0E41_19590 [Hydrogenophaga sp. A37]|nr:hypothetical protein B0E41_19590 [Hydrogenophaga sp. A37]
MALLAPLAHAVDRAAIDAQYQRDRSACAGKEDLSSREACLREAGAVRQEALQGKVGDNTTPDDWRRNAMVRCQAHQNAFERSECERRMMGEGQVRGSVESGGVLREIITIIPPATPGPDSAPK